MTVKSNIIRRKVRKLIKEGYFPKQAVAIAYKYYDKGCLGRRGGLKPKCRKKSKRSKKTKKRKSKRSRKKKSRKKKSRKRKSRKKKSRKRKSRKKKSRKKKKSYKMYNRMSEAYNLRTIDLTSIDKNMIAENMNINEPFTIYSNRDQMKYFPVFYSLDKALSASPSRGVHLIVPGLLPAPDGKWKTGSPHKIYYMPNDSKPHHHGDAPHHLVDWDISEVFEMKDMKWHSVENKRIQKYRNVKGILDFNKGLGNKPVETWIDWRIPHNKKQYPELIVKKNSIIWWDFYNTHNLGMVNTKRKYSVNDLSDVRVISKNSDKKSQTLVTIMNKVGVYYFVCSVKDHAKLGHKIIIKVI